MLDEKFNYLLGNNGSIYLITNMVSFNGLLVVVKKTVISLYLLMTLQYFDFQFAEPEPLCNVVQVNVSQVSRIEKKVENHCTKTLP